MKASMVLVMLTAVVVANQVEKMTLVTDVKEISTNYGNPWEHGGNEPNCHGGGFSSIPTGVSGNCCLPRAQGDKCPQDKPDNTTAVPYALIYSDFGRFCALVCRGWSTGTCPSGASCRTLPSQTVPDNKKVGICMYPDRVFNYHISIIKQ